MSTVVLFEYPLTEKMRIWLRVEFLINQLHDIITFTSSISIIGIFKIIADLLDIFERVDMRTEILKELEHQQKKLCSWSNVPGVDETIVKKLYRKIETYSNELINVPRVGKQLRDDRLISSVRQRLSIPGGCCSFDLPSLHIWLNQKKSLRDEQISHWQASLNPLCKSLNIILDLIRQSSCFRNQISLNGFYQDSIKGSCLLRLQLMIEDALYPKVSGYRTRYAIRFLPLNGEFNEVPEQFNFKLACC